jgi:hypothetical protein
VKSPPPLAVTFGVAGKINGAVIGSQYSWEGIESVLQNVFGADSKKNAMLTLKDLSVGNPRSIFLHQERVSLGFVLSLGFVIS